MSEHLDWMSSSEVWDEDELRDANKDRVESEKGQEEPEVFPEREVRVESVGRGGGSANTVIPPVDL